MRNNKTLALIFSTLLIGRAHAADATPDHPKGGPPEFKSLKYRLVGPAAGGRICRVAGVPGDPLVYYAATASGGVWKSSDGGMQWEPAFKDLPVSSVGSLAVAASDPNVIYIGTGEANIRGNVAAGDGIYKSTDGGKTWTHVWKAIGQIGTMLVHPRNADVAYAAVLGHAFGPNPERGVYRTTDGGKTWQRVLYKDPDTGASDVCFDPSNPRIVFAGLWQARRRPWDLTSGGPGSGLYVSRDGGDTWKQLTGKPPEGTTAGKGLPEGIWGKIGVAVAPSDGRRVYALIEAEKGGLFRSDDGGETWTLASGDHAIRQRAWYYSSLTIDPRNPDVVWCPQVSMLKSIDGGKTFARVKGLHHGDHHDLWIDPLNPRRLIDADDGGLNVSTDGGTSWYAPPLPLCQFYHVAVDNDTPYHVSGCMQDLGTAEGPSNSLASTITNGDWWDVGGGEAGHTAHDWSDPNIVYAGEYGGYITRFDRRTHQSRNVSAYPYNPSGHGGEDLRYRFQWTAPILVSPHDPHVVYHGANVLFKTSDGGQHWSIISGDLTRNDKAKQKWAGGPITGDNTGVEIYCTIFALAESPRQKDLLWAGSDDGLVHVSRDGGQHWTNVTPKGFPEWATVSIIEPSPFDSATAYIVIDAHRLDDYRPYLFKTTDFGQSWKSLGSGLPQDVYLHSVREDPKRRGLLYAGTERGVMFSLDEGTTWKPLKLNLPAVAVHDLLVKNNDLVLATLGRSIWILDDLTPIRTFSADIARADAYLFPIQPTVRFHYHAAFHGPSVGDNPPQGAVITYFLKAKPKAPISLTIEDARGGAVTTLKSEDKDKDKDKKKEEPDEDSEEDPDYQEMRPKKTILKTEPGINRIAWDLRYDGAEKIPGAKVDSGTPDIGPQVPPGTYTLKLNVDGKTLVSSMVVLPDPRSRTNVTAHDEQLQMALQMRDTINRLTKTVRSIRSICKQIEFRNGLLKSNLKAADLIKQGKELRDRFCALEEKLHNPKAKVTYDILAQKGGAKLYSLLAFLFESVKDGEGTPTQGMREMYAEYVKDLQQLTDQYNALVVELARLNETAKGLAIPNIIIP